MFIGVIGHTLILMLWLFTRTPLGAFALYIPSYLFLQMSFIGHDTIITDLTQLKTRSSIIGIMSMIAGVIGATSPYTGTLLMTEFGAKAPFFAAFVYSILVCLFLSMLKSDRF
jgi:hypothetical protein